MVEYDAMKEDGIQIHGIIVTHPDCDHMNGIKKLLEKHNRVNWYIRYKLMRFMRPEKETRKKKRVVVVYIIPVTSRWVRLCKINDKMYYNNKPVAPRQAIVLKISWKIE